MDYAASPFEIKNLSDTGQIEGILAGFGNVDMGGDQLMPGCLTKSLAARSAPLPMLFAHDLKRPIGAWREWSETNTGLHVKGGITLATRDGQEAYALAKDGALGGLSIGWLPSKAHNDRSGARVVTEADIFEGSLVPVPMNPTTRVTSVKSIGGARDIEDMLRDAGLSGRKAKFAAGAAWKALNENTEDPELASIAQLFDQHAARLAAR